MLYQGITRTPEEVKLLRQQLKEHDLQVDVQIIYGVMADCPWIRKVRMVYFPEFRGFSPEFTDDSGGVVKDFERWNPAACAIQNRGFSGYHLLKELIVEKTPEGEITYTTEDFAPWPDNRRSLVEALGGKKP